MRRCSYVVVGLGFGLALVGTARAAAPADAAVIDIDVDVADLPDSRANIAETVHAELQRLLSEQSEHGSLPAGVLPLEDRRLLVELRPGPIPGADDILIRVESQLDGVMLGETATENCLSCSDEQVAEKALPMLRPLLEDFPAPAPAPAPAPEPAAGDSSSGADLAADQPDPDRPSQGLLIAGGSMLGAGVVGLGIGIGLIVTNERLVSEPGAAQLDLIQYRPTGIAVAVVGGVAAVTGAALLGVALRGHKRSSVAAGPVLSPGSYGVALSGCF